MNIEPIARIHTDGGQHRRDSRLFFTVDDRPLDRCGAAVTREKRSVDIDATVLRDIQIGLRK